MASDNGHRDKCEESCHVLGSASSGLQAQGPGELSQDFAKFPSGVQKASYRRSIEDHARCTSCACVYISVHVLMCVYM